MVFKFAAGLGLRTSGKPSVFAFLRPLENYSSPGPLRVRILRPAILASLSIAGLGFEPRYPPPKGGVLPLDDPAANNDIMRIDSPFHKSRQQRAPKGDAVRQRRSFVSRPRGARGAYRD